MHLLSYAFDLRAAQWPLKAQTMAAILSDWRAYGDGFQSDIFILNKFICQYQIVAQETSLVRVEHPPTHSRTEWVAIFY